jgi:DNA-binding transcriptional MerR regulator
MAGYTIGQAAERSGFSASTLRYYEDIDLVRPAGRTEAGYRLYDDVALARLGFIARAKQLGCSLDDIRDLVAVWNDDSCEPVQRRFHELVTGKLTDARRRIDELTTFTAQLDAAAARLAGSAIDGPCDDACACATATTPPAGAPAPVAITAKPSAGRAPEPVACTLSADAAGARVGEWHAVLRHARRRVTTARGGIRIELDDAADIAELSRLVAAEQQCCSFFAFALTVDRRGVGLEVDAPVDAGELVDAMFGPPSDGEE